VFIDAFSVFPIGVGWLGWPSSDTRAAGHSAYALKKNRPVVYMVHKVNKAQGITYTYIAVGTTVGIGVKPLYVQ
jgi:hypothetical protein